MLSSFFVIAPLLAVVNAANDWSVACTTGECSYDIPTTNGSTASGTVTIWGSQDAISDITTAADWEILDCDPNALAQDIRLVCNSASDSKCSHLYQNTGAVNKIVRLPENCGSSAFARVAKAWVPDDQSIPSSIAARLVRRDGAQPQVKALSLDTNFGAVDWSKTGQVNIAIQGANVPGASGTIQIPPSRRTTRLSQRGLIDFVKGAISSIASNSVDLSKNIDLPPLDLQKKINLFNKSIDCGPVTAKVSADVDGSVHAVASVGVAATGTIIPPKITDLGLVATLNGNVQGTLSLTADVAGSVDSGKIQLVSLGIPGLDIPGIFSLGPTFTVDAQATANLDVNLDVETQINLDINNAQLSFPPWVRQRARWERVLHRRYAPDVKATGTLAVHLIPALNFGVSAFGGKAKAEIDLALDTSASLKLSLEASADAETTIGGGGSTSTDTNTNTNTKGTTDSTSTTASNTMTSKGSMHTTTSSANSNKMMHKSTSTKAMMHKSTSTKAMMHKSTSTKAAMHKSTSTKAMMHKSTSTAKAMHTSASPMAHSAAPSPSSSGMYGRAVTSSFGGCFEVDAGLAITAGVQGDFFGLFNADKQDTLFSKNFVIFKKCFGAQATRKRSSLFALSRLDRKSESSSSLGRRAGLTCPAGNVKSAATLVDETIKAAAIKAA
ncbi:hypothetical protein MVEN_00193100 [Mycena venus]|uniref:Uncharacterized protein n=1 Tax=Mycena venus TaxID=2733690 RepID=A0A8H6Z1I8_9AGAR|nr:hypothetical protein MVEN_00193100 [Mycena venus]